MEQPSQKRPSVPGWMGGASFLGGLAGLLLPAPTLLPVAAVATGAAVTAAAIPACRKKRPIFWGGIAFGLILLTTTLLRTFVILPAAPYGDQTVSLSGTVTDYGITQSGTPWYTLLPGTEAPFRGRVRLYCNEKTDPEALPGDRLTLTLQTDPQDKLPFSLAGEGIALTGYMIGEAQLTRPDWSLLRSFDWLRRQTAHQIRQVIGPEEGDSAVAFLLGDTSGMSRDTLSHYRRAGISHVLSVSGFHLSILTGVLVLLFTLIGVPKKYRYPATVPFVLLMMVLSGFSAGVLRAGMMLILLSAGKLLRLRLTSRDTLGGAIFLILLVDPFAAGDVGLQLSYLALQGVLFAGELTRPVFFFKLPVSLRKPAHAVFSAAILSLLATLFCLPVLALTFGRINPLGPVSSVVLLPLLSPALVLAAVALVLSLIPGIRLVAPLVGKAASLCLWGIEWYCGEVSALSFSEISFGEPWLWVWLGLSAVILLPVIFCPDPKRLGAVLVLSACLFGVGQLSAGYFSAGVTTLDAQIGAGSFLSLSRDGQTILIAENEFALRKGSTHPSVASARQAALLLPGDALPDADFLPQHTSLTLLPDSDGTPPQPIPEDRGYFFSSKTGWAIWLTEGVIVTRGAYPLSELPAECRRAMAVVILSGSAPGLDTLDPSVVVMGEEAGDAYPALRALAARGCTLCTASSIRLRSGDCLTWVER